MKLAQMHLLAQIPNLTTIPILDNPHNTYLDSHISPSQLPQKSWHCTFEGIVGPTLHRRQSARHALRGAASPCRKSFPSIPLSIGKSFPSFPLSSWKSFPSIPLLFKHRANTKRVLRLLAAASPEPEVAEPAKTASPEPAEPDDPGNGIPKKEFFVHFVGIGGAGLSALASLALQQGLRVSGSDLEDSELLRQLRNKGAEVFVGHSASNIGQSSSNIGVRSTPDAVVVSSAVPDGNPEVEAAKLLNIPIYKRGEWLARITESTNLIAVAGSHGKTSTTAMLALALQGAGLDVSALVGAQVPQFPERGSVVLGNSSFFILEADEYDGCFLSLNPRIAVVTNIEWEHVDKFKDEAAVREMFFSFVSKLQPGGILVACRENAGARAVADQLARSSQTPETTNLENRRDNEIPQERAIVSSLSSLLRSPEEGGPTPTPVASASGSAESSSSSAESSSSSATSSSSSAESSSSSAESSSSSATSSSSSARRVVTYGLSEANDWRAIMLSPNPQGGTDFVVVNGGAPVAKVTLSIPGIHSVLNALAVIVVSSIVSSLPECSSRKSNLLQAAAASLASFEGASRRFEVVGKAKGGVVLIDDYAHHPTEIRATLQAARQRYDSVPIWVVFQPHTYSRTEKLLDDLAPAFSAANVVYITEIYAAREQNPSGITGQSLADVVTGPITTYIPDLETIIDRLEQEVRAFNLEREAKAEAAGAPVFRWPPSPGELVIITMGAGTVTKVCRELLVRLQDT